MQCARYLDLTNGDIRINQAFDGRTWILEMYRLVAAVIANPQVLPNMGRATGQKIIEETQDIVGRLQSRPRLWF